MRNKLLYLVVLLVFASCSSEKPDNIEPTLHTLDATYITRTSATLNGSVALQGRSRMPDVVFRYGKGNLSKSATAIIKGENISATVDGLTAGTTYQYQLQAQGADIYGNIMSFTTLPNVLPTVDKATVFSHGPVSAIIGFEVPDNGGEALTDAGCYVVEGKASILADKASATKYKASKMADAEQSWRIIATGLKMNTTYTVFPYAANTIGEKVGEGIAFATGEAYMVLTAGDLPTLIEGSDIGEKISIGGPLNGDDLAYLRKLPLTDIDLTDAHIVSGGSPYNESFYSEDNVVGQNLFAGCTHLESLTLPDDVITIAKDAFYDCSCLKEITMPSAAKTINPSGGCTALENIFVSEANNNYKSAEGVLTNINETELIWFPAGRKGEYSLPPTVTAIGENAFRGSGLTEIHLPANLKSLGQGAFYGSNIEKMTLPDKLANIPTGAFQKCSRLKMVSLGASTELISDYAFDGCPLTDIYVNAATPPVCSSYAFATTGSDFTKTCTLHVPQGRAKYYRASKYWNVFTHIKE